MEPCKNNVCMFNISELNVVQNNNAEFLKARVQLKGNSLQAGVTQ